MQANPAILQRKYARIVKLFAEQAGLSYEEALVSSTTPRRMILSATELQTCIVSAMNTSLTNY